MQSIKALFIPTLNSGVSYWRMYNPVLAGVRTKTIDGHLLWWQKDLHTNHPWQNEITDSRFHASITAEMSAGCRTADVIVIGMVHTSAALTAMFGMRECFGKPVIVEADDNILSCPTYNPASPFYNPSSQLRKLAVAQMREADAIVVTTPDLKEVYSEFNDHVYIVPNSIDFKLWGSAKRILRKGKITIGWAGGATHNDDLAIVKPAIEFLTNKYKDVEFVFLHGASEEVRKMKGVKICNKFERIDKYPKYIASHGFDIGIAPLVDNAFNRGKSNLRWLEYSALGIPCVASNVGHFAQTINNGVDGLLCDNPQDFIDNLELLITNTQRRKDIAKCAKERVQKDFNIDNTVVLYRDVLKEVIDRGQVVGNIVQKESNHKQTIEA